MAKRSERPDTTRRREKANLLYVFFFIFFEAFVFFA